jgi:hypothetical protein
LWKAGRKKRILFLADRNVLVDQTMVNDFRPFGAAMAKLSRRLGNFIDLEAKYPVLVTTSRLHFTGVDAQTCRLIMLDRSVGSMTEFKQIVGRGTRVHEDTKKFYFTLIDFRGANSRFWVDFKDFGFYRLKPLDIYYVGGFGVMGWVIADDDRAAKVDPLGDDSSRPLWVLPSTEDRGRNERDAYQLP